MSLEVKILQIEKEEAGKIVYVAVSGKLEKEDYEMFVPEMEREIEEHGKISLLFELLDFRGWSVGAAWEDLKAGTESAWDSLGAETKIKYEENIKELRQKLEEARQTLTKINDASEDTWEDLKQGAETIWDMYKTSFKKAKSEFKRGYRECLEE